MFTGVRFMVDKSRIHSVRYEIVPYTYPHGTHEHMCTHPIYVTDNYNIRTVIATL